MSDDFKNNVELKTCGCSIHEIIGCLELETRRLILTCLDEQFDTKEDATDENCKEKK